MPVMVGRQLIPRYFAERSEEKGRESNKKLVERTRSLGSRVLLLKVLRSEEQGLVGRRQVCAIAGQWKLNERTTHGNTR
ncbi:hypothetical protein K0M31_000185 [Melipona bicolor]|uniref:Uncharacterized protein n=1 Tax=Melipona bicolor TaxID=60889 RepID=A0AA40GCZ9_9HYME|nr:hypothetical protein K0M31_000185 [Melipona bicolor]